MNPEGFRGTHHAPADAAASGIGDNSCNPCLDFISSDATLDRYGEIISAAGWELESYQRNPVFQNAHQYGDIIFTIGRALITEIRSSPAAPPLLGERAGVRASSPTPHLFQRIQFAADVNPMAKIAYGLYSGKFLSAVSVGFIPVAWENGTKDTPYRRKYIAQELLEVSAVAIPANPNALALGLKSGALEKSDLRDLADLLRHTLDHPAAPWTVAAERSGDAALAPINYPRLITLARQLHQILKHL